MKKIKQVQNDDKTYFIIITEDDTWMSITKLNGECWTDIGEMWEDFWLGKFKRYDGQYKEHKSVACF